MASTQSILLGLGAALCVFSVTRLGLWALNGWTVRMHHRHQFRLSRRLLKQQIAEVRESGDPSGSPAQSRQTSKAAHHGDWSGFRTFVVKNVVKEVESVTSVYLAPEDGKPIVDFLSGQHLTLKIPVHGQPRPVVRCYSLSNGGILSDSNFGADGEPAGPFYRISVKQFIAPVPPTQDNPSGERHGLASSHINASLKVGDRLEVKSPSGSFWLDESASSSIVMLAGGIGITPMLSMLERLQALAASGQAANASQSANRTATLFYGVRNSADHAFANQLKKIADAMPQVRVVTCYSQPSSSDLQENQERVTGRVSIELLRRVLGDNDHEFYLCGPPAFMESLYEGLLDWNVPREKINFEAFGPASIGKEKKSNASTDGQPRETPPVKFAASNKAVLWDDQCDSLLELAEANEIFPDSGCRAGSCGSCETGLISGKVRYQDDQNPTCDSGKCLLCIAVPEGPVELDL